MLHLSKTSPHPEIQSHPSSLCCYIRLRQSFPSTFSLRFCLVVTFFISNTSISNVKFSQIIVQSLMFQPKATPDWFIPDAHEKMQFRLPKKSATKVCWFLSWKQCIFFHVRGSMGLLGYLSNFATGSQKFLFSKEIIKTIIFQMQISKMKPKSSNFFIWFFR